MSLDAALQLALFCLLLVLATRPLGGAMARIYQANSLPGERLLYRVASVDPTEEMSWKSYAIAVLLFNVIGLVFCYLLQRLQGALPANPASLGAVSPDSSFNTAISFASNTNWQGYAGESTLSYLTQMLGLAVQNFVSAATGMAVLVAFVRGISRHTRDTIGNFWVDLARSTIYILLPLSIVGALFLVSQGVVQTFDGGGEIPLGPAASQVIIKQLGTNGGGFFNANSAHPLEDPTPLANLVEMFAIVVLPAALCVTFGDLVGDRRQGWAVLAAMFAIFIPLLIVCVLQEQAPNPAFAHLPVDPSGGNMEGKEVRFGVANSALWATVTTAASNGSVNAMHDSFSPLGGLVPLWLMQLGEIVFGGVGSGLYGMLVFAVVAVFVAGLMVGRTPEYLGKKIEAYEMKMASLVILVPPALVLVGTAIACSTEAGQKGVANPSAHGFTEILYALSSASNNNGSAFAGLSANTPFYNTLLGICMFCARYWLIVPVLAIAGGLARKKKIPVSSGTLPTHTPLFVGLLVGVIIVVGALTFVPSLALGPIVEHLMARSS